MDVQTITTTEQWDRQVQSTKDRPLVVLKHSTRCPISAGAYEAFRSHVEKEANPQYDYAVVYVIDARPVSDKIAETLGVKHESPQVLLVKDGKAVWHESHYNITEAELSKSLR